MVSDERSPKTQMRAYRGEPYQAALRCAHTALQRMLLRATAGGAMQRAVHRCRLRCDATSSACQVGPTPGALGVL